MQKLLNIVFFLVCTCYLQAQTPFYISLNKFNGLPSNEVYDIFQDSKGYIWLACGRGLVRYDGFEYKIYNNIKQSSKAGALIKEDKNGRIWYMNFDNLLYFVEKDSLHTFPQAQNSNLHLYALMGNILLLPIKNKIEIWDIQHFQKIKEVQLPNQVEVLQGAKQIGDYLYFFHHRIGLCKISKTGTITFIQQLPEINHNSFAISIQNIGNEVFVATKFGTKSTFLYHISTQNEVKKWTLPINYLQLLAQTDQYLWFCTPKGVYMVNQNGELLQKGKSIFSDHNITTLYKDKEQNYWFGTSNEGILLVPNFETKRYELEKDKPFLLAKMGNSLFIGTKKGNIHTFDLSKQEIKPFYQNQSGHELYFLYSDSLKKQLLCTSDKFRILNMEGKVVESHQDAVKDACRIGNNALACAFSGAVVWWKEKGFEAENTFPYSQNNATTYQYLLKSCRGKSLAYLPHNQTLYFTTNLGTFKADNEKVSEILDNGKKIYFSFLRAYQKEVYALESKGSLSKINEKGILQKDILKGWQFQRMRLLADRLFLFSEKTLYYIDLKTNTLTPQKLEVGISAEEINDILLVGESLYLATDVGFLEINWQNSQKKYPNPTLLVHDINVQGQKFSLTDNISLFYTQNEVEIKYAILSFRNSGDKMVYYRINHSEWQPLSPQSRSLKLAGLAPNKYEIALKLGDNIQKLHFDIKPPFWKSTWFFIILLLIISILSYYFYYTRTQMLKKQNALLLEKLKLEKDLHHSLMASIKSQMNPHFFFNALNTLQAFIFSDDKRNAANYLGRFSRLMRTILEMSEKDEVSLSEEIEALQLYLELEKSRFDEEFTYHFSVQKDLQTDKIFIPSMIIQPYIENAIKHGLLHKKNNRILKISIENQQNSLVIMIDDNGIGRKRAEELKQIRKKKHQSFATKANLKRVELLNQEKANIGVSYIDKIAENGEPQGTIVVIQLPLNQRFS